MGNQANLNQGFSFNNLVQGGASPTDQMIDLLRQMNNLLTSMNNNMAAMAQAGQQAAAGSPRVNSLMSPEEAAEKAADKEFMGKRRGIDKIVSGVSGLLPAKAGRALRAGHQIFKGVQDITRAQRPPFARPAPTPKQRRSPTRRVPSRKPLQPTPRRARRPVQPTRVSPTGGTRFTVPPLQTVSTGQRSQRPGSGLLGASPTMVQSPQKMPGFTRVFKTPATRTTKSQAAPTTFSRQPVGGQQRNVLPQSGQSKMDVSPLREMFTQLNTTMQSLIEAINELRQSSVQSNEQRSVGVPSEGERVGGERKSSAGDTISDSFDADTIIDALRASGGQPDLPKGRGRPQSRTQSGMGEAGQIIDIVSLVTKLAEA